MKDARHHTTADRMTAARAGSACRTPRGTIALPGRDRPLESDRRSPSNARRQPAPPACERARTSCGAGDRGSAFTSISHSCFEPSPRLTLRGLGTGCPSLRASRAQPGRRGSHATHRPPGCYPAATATGRLGRKSATFRAEPFALLRRLSACTGRFVAALRPLPTEWRRRESNPRPRSHRTERLRA